MQARQGAASGNEGSNDSACVDNDDEQAGLTPEDLAELEQLKGDIAARTAELIAAGATSTQVKKKDLWPLTAPSPKR